MASINYVEELRKHYGSMGFPPYKWTINDSYYNHEDAEEDINCVFPIGNNFGEPSNPGQQRLILERALQLVVEVETGGYLEDWPETWHSPVEYFRGRTND